MARRPTLGEVLKERRKERRMTLVQVGADLGLVNGNFIGMVERGERMPSDERLLQMADVLDLDGRGLLAMKYAATHGAAAEVLLAPPEPQHPRTRRLLLATCSNAEEMGQEFARGEWTAIERVVYQALLEYVVLPGIEIDRYSPKRLRDRLVRHRKRRPEEPVDPWVLEEEAETFVPWVREQFVSWSLDVPTLTISIRHSDDDGDVSTVPLIDRELRQRMMAFARPEAAPASTASAGALTLEEFLVAEGLLPDDVEEVLMMVALKKKRAQRAAG
jgi:transcriptional regulator with XRE-family HTH domain